MKLFVIAAVVLSLVITANAQVQKSQEKSFTELQKLVEEVHIDPFSSQAYRELYSYEHFIEDYVTEHPDSAAGWYYLGFITSQGLSRNRAEKAYQKAIELKPDFAEAYIGLASYYRSPSWCGNTIRPKEGRDLVDKKVKPLLEKAISLQPQFPYSYAAFGNSYFQLSRYEEAIAAYEKALSVNPELITCYESLGECYERLGFDNQAIMMYEQASRSYLQSISQLSEKSDDEKIRKGQMQAHVVELSEKCGELFLKEKKYQEALSMFKRTVELKFDYSDTHLQLGLIYLALGDKKSALAEHAFLVKMSKKPKELDNVREIILKEADQLLEQINKHL